MYFIKLRKRGQKRPESTTSLEFYTWRLKVKNYENPIFSSLCTAFSLGSHLLQCGLGVNAPMETGSPNCPRECILSESEIALCANSL